MIEKIYDAVVIGGGAAGMASARKILSRGFNVAVVERENRLGGILNQCIHNGFGLHYFKKELTGPEYADNFIEMVKEGEGIDLFLETTVLTILEESDFKIVSGYSQNFGVIKIKTKVIVLAMGCRERNRGNIGIPGTRPAGVFTAGLAQRLVNIEGYIPGNEIVIVGSGDIGLIMARRMTWIGAKVKAVVEIQPYPSGLTRNIVQCLNDFNIPLYLSHVISKIYGKNRVEGVDITPLEGGKQIAGRTFHLSCDTLLLSVGLVPENELSKKLDIKINPDTNGPFVDAHQMTNKKGVFACGNVLHVHDLVDYVTEEAEKTGYFAAEYLKSNLNEDQYKVTAGPNIRYVCPNQYDPWVENKFYMRPMIVKNNAVLEIKLNGQVIKTQKLLHVQPSEMLSFTANKDMLAEHQNIIDRNMNFNNLEFVLL